MRGRTARSGVLRLAVLLGLVALAPTAHGQGVGESTRPSGARSESAALDVGTGQPYRTLAAALAAAPPGATITVHGGTHKGPFVLDKPVNLVGLERPTLDGGGAGSVVQATVPGSRIQGFRIVGSGSQPHREDAAILALGTVEITDNVLEDVLYGIDLKRATNSLITGNTVRGRAIDVARRGDGIRLWESHDTVVADNQVLGARDVVVWYSRNVELRSNTVRDGRYGLHTMYADNGRVVGNHIADNSVGAYVMYSHGLELVGNAILGNHGPSGYGIALKDSDDVTVRDNVLAGNRVGLYVDNTPTSADAFSRLRGNVVAYNDVGLLLLPAVKRNEVGQNAFVDNYEHVALTASGTLSDNEWSPAGRGNYWSGYAGYDRDQDGIGDRPYVQQGLFRSMITDTPALRLFAWSPVQSALDLSARAFPVFMPPPILEDAAPLTAPPPPPLAPEPTHPLGLGLAAAALLAGGAAVLVWGGGGAVAARVPLRRRIRLGAQA